MKLRKRRGDQQYFEALRDEEETYNAVVAKLNELSAEDKLKIIEELNEAAPDFDVSSSLFEGVHSAFVFAITDLQEEDFTKLSQVLVEVGIQFEEPDK